MTVDGGIMCRDSGVRHVEVKSLGLESRNITPFKTVVPYRWPSARTDLYWCSGSENVQDLSKLGEGRARCYVV